jgi:uncharacterized protein (TIGR02145 family)
MKHILLFLTATISCQIPLPAQKVEKPSDAVVIASGTAITGKEPQPWRCGQPVTDPRDGQVYQTVSIVNNCWMAQNLNYGVQIQMNNPPFDNGIVEKYCYDDALCSIYGGLYRYGEAMQYNFTDGAQGACPPGWHVPTGGEYNQMHAYLNIMYYDFGGMLKESGLAHWNPPNTGATNETGFSAFGAGYFEVFGSNYYYHLGNVAFFWYSAATAHARRLDFDNDDFTYLSTSMPVAYSVRCVYDLPVTTQKIRNIQADGPRCYNATDTIITAGDGTFFEILGNDFSTMISGKVIQLLPGTQVIQGGRLSASITQSGQYCSMPPSKQVAASAQNPGTPKPAQKSGNELFSVYPNPATDIVTIEVKEGQVNSAVAEIYDQIGFRVFSEIMDLSDDAGTLDIGHLPEGIYFLKIISNGNTAMMKIVKNLNPVR